MPVDAEAISVQAITKKRRRLPVRGWMVWVILLLAVAGGGYWYMRSHAAATTTVHYVTAPVAKGDITVTVTAVGSVQPIQEVNVGSLISGTISELAVKINDKVKTGQVLAKLDTSSLEAELARDQALLSAAQAQVENAKAGQDAAATALERATKMFDKGLSAEQDLTNAETAARQANAVLASAKANVQVAEANVKLSQTSIDKAVIVAPIDGIVLDMTADLGLTVSATGATITLFTLAHDLGEMELQANVDEADIGNIAVGDPASFSVDAYLGQTFPAKVSEMHYAPQTVDSIVTYPTILSIDNSDHRLRPGMTASADITVQHVAGVLTVPNSAFRFTPPLAPAAAQRSTGLLGMLFSAGAPGANTRQRTTVTNAVTKEGYRSLYVLKDGVAEQVAVKTGVTNGDLTEVTDGPLAAGDLVITSQTTGK